MESLGFPRQFVSSTYAPFDYIGDFFRGTRGIMLDMYRNPDKLLAAIDKVLPSLIEQAVSAAKTAASTGSSSLSTRVWTASCPRNSSTPSTGLR